MVGTYAPESLSDPRVHADTRLELRGDDTCRMTDFPYVNYASSESSTLSYFNQNATWNIMGLGGVRLVITMSGTEDEFNILNTSAPYRIAQSGESVEFDELILHKLP
jgi:hypothetical protein